MSPAPASAPPPDPGQTPARSDQRRLTALRELQLIKDHQEGDSEAIGELLGAYQHRVYAVCYRMLRNADEASDLTQEALLKVMEGLGGYDGRAALSTWIIRVTMNCCLSHLRKQKVRRHGSLDEPSREGGTWGTNLPAEGEPSALRRVEQAEMRAILLRALRGLDSQMRAVLVLRDLQDLDYHQIGEVMGVPIGTVKSRLFRARAALRAAAEQEMSGAQGSEEGPEPTGRG